MSEPYIEYRHCPICKRETKQECVDSDHERDSSGDYRCCYSCGAEYFGTTGKYEKRDFPGNMKKTETVDDNRDISHSDWWRG